MSRILKSIFGRQLGIDVSGYLTSPIGAKLPALYLGASGSEVQLTNPAYNGVQSTASMIATGITALNSSSTTYQIPAPALNKRITLTTSATSTGIKYATLVSGGLNQGASSQQGGTAAVFNTLGFGSTVAQTISLLGISASNYIIESNVGTVTLSTA